MDASSQNDSLHVSESGAADPEQAKLSASAATDPAPTPTPGEIEATPTETRVVATESAVETPPPVTEPTIETLPRTLIPWLSTADFGAAAAAAAGPETAARRRIAPLAIAAALATFAMVVVGGVAINDHREQASALAAKANESSALAVSLAELKTRLDMLEATRAKDETAEMRKIAADVKAAAASTRDVGVTLAQINSRIDRIEKDAGARIDKLSEKVDHDSAAHFADIAARIDRLEKKPAPAVASAAPVPAPGPTKSPAFPNVANDTTGSIGGPKTVLRGYTLEDIEGNMAVIDGRDGPMTVGVGDAIPGAGRVLRIDRHGRDWAVVTTQGQIVSEPGAY